MIRYDNYNTTHESEFKLINKNFVNIKIPIKKSKFVKNIKFLSDYKDKIEKIVFNNKDVEINNNIFELNETNDGIYNLMIYFKQSYLDKCFQGIYVIGYYYPSCNCCCEDFQCKKDEYDNYYENDPSYEKKNEEKKYNISIPKMLFNIFYEIQENIPIYNSNIF
jgi:hypothetical protein